MSTHKLKKLALATLLCANSISFAQEDSEAESVDFTMPYINPDRNCITDGMKSPDGVEYRYLFSKDCRTVHVLPPLERKQIIKGKPVNLDSCTGYFQRMSAINESGAEIDDMIKTRRGYEAQLSKTTSTSKEADLLKKIEHINQRLVFNEQSLQKLIDSKNEVYGQIPGAQFAVTLKPAVTPNEINQIRYLNEPLLNRIVEKEIHTTDANGQPKVEKIETVKRSALLAYKPAFSLFSFKYKMPEDSIKNGGIVWTSIPNLEYLEQVGSKTGLIHVEANDITSADIQMSVAVVCPKATLNEKNQYELKTEELDPFFVVNQTFEVQQMFAQGYKASLNIDNVIKQIVKHKTTHTEQGFKKSSVFEPTMDTKIEELLNFKWITEYATEETTELADILEIKKAVTANLIDDYIDKLVKAGILSFEDPPPLESAEGGYVDDTRVANRCWSEKRGGISGAFGGRRTVCADFTYTVKVWKDGESEENLKKLLKLNVVSEDNMSINQTAPFRFTTTFTR